jgi:hypothetical protein
MRYFNHYQESNTQKKFHLDQLHRFGDYSSSKPDDTKEPFIFTKGGQDKELFERRDDLHKFSSSFLPAVLLKILPLLFFILVFNLYVFQAVNTQSLEYQVKKARQRVRKALLRNNELRLSLSQKLSFSQIEKKALLDIGSETLDDPTRFNRIFYLELPDYEKDSAFPLNKPTDK